MNCAYFSIALWKFSESSIIVQGYNLYLSWGCIYQTVWVVGYWSTIVQHSDQSRPIDCQVPTTDVNYSTTLSEEHSLHATLQLNYFPDMKMCWNVHNNAYSSSDSVGIYPYYCIIGICDQAVNGWSEGINTVMYNSVKPWWPADCL